MSPPIFVVRALGDLQALMRITNVFAQRGVMPHLLTSRADGGWLIVEVQLAAGDTDIAALLLERLRAITCVDRAELIGASR